MKNKKILLMTAYGEYFLGSELWTFTVSQELKRLGYNVEMFCYLRGVMTDSFSYNGIKVIDEIEDKYDIAIINHNSTLIQAPKSAYKIFTSHGSSVELEQPIIGADKYVSISEEVYDNLYEKGFYSDIILNPVDMDRFKSIRPINDKLKNVLLLSNKIRPMSQEFQEINKACKELDLNLIPIGLDMGTSQWETEMWINNADLVISMGRGVYDAMSAERNVIVSGYGRLAGFIDKKSYKEYIKTNCATREHHEILTADKLIEEFKKYNPKQGKINREIIKQNHNVIDVVNKYLKYGTDL